MEPNKCFALCYKQVVTTERKAHDSVTLEEYPVYRLIYKNN